MKRLLFLLLFASTVFNGLGQDIDSLTLSQLKLNFSVPDMPAFKMLGSDPSNLLKPSTPKALAVTLSPFYNSTELIIPQSFAMEISPALLINADKGPTELVKYSENAWINSFRISLGTQSDAASVTGGRNLAIGFRITPIDKGDLTTDIGFQKKISMKLSEFRNRVRTVYMRDFAAMRNIDMNQEDWDFKIMGDPKLKSQFDAYIISREDESETSINKEVEIMKVQYKKDYWNATKFDIAIGVLSSSSDSLAKNIRFRQAALWLTYALRCGTKGQLLVGLNNSFNKISTDDIKNDETFVDISLPARFLLGTNRVKGFAEFQYEYKGNEKINYILMNFGAEINITDGFWMDFTGGALRNITDGTTSFVTNLNVKLTFPEKFSFF